MSHVCPCMSMYVHACPCMYMCYDCFPLQEHFPAFRSFVNKLKKSLPIKKSRGDYKMLFEILTLSVTFSYFFRLGGRDLKGTKANPKVTKLIDIFTCTICTSCKLLVKRKKNSFTNYTINDFNSNLHRMVY